MLSSSSSILFILGIGIFGGIAGAWFFQKIKVPQVLGYLVIGIIIGKSGLHLINSSVISSLNNFNYFALGIIGFMVGGELHLSTMKKYGKQFSAILFGEGILSFSLVTLSTSLILYVFTKNFTVSIAAGIVFGAIASATDPASTMSVLWEYRAKGLLTTTIIAIVALDDALAMTLYGLGTGLAQLLIGGNTSISTQLIKICIELFGAVLMGGLAGIFMNLIVRFSIDKTRTMVFGIATLLILIALSLTLHVDVILASMTMGIVVTNMAPNRSKAFFDLVKSFSAPIYVLFFVLVGARLVLGNMPWFLWAIVVSYVVFRSIGKVIGAWIGAKISNAEPIVKNYTGMALFAQGGVAIGLSIMATQHLGNLQIANGINLGDVIITGVTATTFIVQIIGPPMTKLAVKLAKETGKNKTEEDIISKWKVADVLDFKVPHVKMADSVKHVVSLFSGSEYFCLPVVDQDGKSIGIITVNDLKHLIASQDTWDWLLASDIVEPAPEIITKSESLEEAITALNQLGREQLPVVESVENPVPVGILDLRIVKKLVNNELVGV
ncbi:MAG: cation:proton antiporter [Spirochaetes bacterium]|jgi:Kef-type K+ transport system membrane component KefB/CBS domain-containing protein|nr:cation:proton antiporter [Spirochaetota bacterium]